MCDDKENVEEEEEEEEEEDVWNGEDFRRFLDEDSAYASDKHDTRPELLFTILL